MSSVNEFFEALPARVDPARTTGVNKTYVFDISGAGVWTVTVTDGGVEVTEGDTGGSDVTISSSAENFERILSGEQKAERAYMTGKIKIKGDMGAAMKLQKLF